MAEKIGGSQIVAKCLKKEGIKTVFTLSGGHTMSMYYACADEGIDVIDCRSEADAVMAADAYAKTTGGPGVVITTAGPGVANTATGMLEAMTARTPVVQIGGACQLELQATGDMQDIDTLGLMKVCTKYARKVYHTHRIADHIDEAFRQAMSGLPGPVYVELPMDVVMGEADADLVKIDEKSRTKTQPWGDASAVMEAAKLLAAAEKPVLVVGNTARYSAEPADAVKELAEYLDMPLTAATVARGLFMDEDHELAQLGGAAASGADVVLALATANDLAFGKFQAPAYREDAKIIMVSPSAETIGFNRAVDVGIVAGAAPAAKQILDAVKGLAQKKDRSEWKKELAEKAAASQKKDDELIYGEAELVRPGRCAAEVAKFLKEQGRDFTVVPDGGDSGGWMNRLSKAHRPAQILGLIGNGSIGIASGTAMGAWYGAKKPVLLYSGDGSYGYNCMEFSNYVKRGLPIIVVISNDSAWGMVKGFEYVIRPETCMKYDTSHHDAIAVNLPFVRYDLIAEALGGYGELVEKAEDIIPALERAAKAGKPALINVKVEDITLGGYSVRTDSLAKSFIPYAKDYIG